MLKIDSYISVKEMKKYNLNYDEVKRRNEKYIKDSLIKYKDYFDNMYKGIDDNILLDEE